MTRLRFTRDAVLDRREIIAFTRANFGPAQASDLQGFFEGALERIETFPESGRRRTDLEVDTRVLRSVHVGGVFVIVYWVRAEVVVVLRILHGARDLGSEIRSDRPFRP